MSTEVEDILKNAHTAKSMQSIFQEDLENLSLLEDSRDSFAFNATLDDSLPGQVLQFYHCRYVHTFASPY